MRLLHISDWHVGLQTGPHPRRPDHEKVFAEIVGIVRDCRPDLVLHTGDVFHSGYPQIEDMRFGLQSLQELAALARVVVIRGNHDSDRLFRVFSILLGRSSNLTFVDLPPALHNGDPIIRIPTGGGGSTIALAPLPFVHSNRFFQHYDDAGTQTATFADRLGGYERALGAALLDGLDPSREVAVFGAHQYVQGAVKSGSERQIHVGDEYATRAVDIPSVSYAAFGHIHKPQRIPGAVEAYYAGSPIQIDFGERDESKRVVFVEAEPSRSAKVESIPLSGGRPLRVVEATLDDLAALASSCAGSLCRVTVKTQTPMSDLSKRVAGALPDADIVDVIDDCAATRVDVVREAYAVEEPTLPELFAEFLTQNPVRNAEASRVQGAFTIVHAAAEAREQPCFPELPEEASLH